MSVGHEVCAEKNNEVEALSRLLTKLQLHGVIATIEAIGGHPDIAHLMQDAGADYILALKRMKKKRTKPSPRTLSACVPHRRPQRQANKAGRRVAK